MKLASLRQRFRPKPPRRRKPVEAPSKERERSKYLKVGEPVYTPAGFGVVDSAFVEGRVQQEVHVKLWKYGSPFWTGMSKDVERARAVECDRCGGSGLIPVDSFIQRCSTCLGTGFSHYRRREP